MPTIYPIKRVDLQPSFSGENQRHYLTAPVDFGDISAWKIQFDVRTKAGTLMLHKANAAAGGDNDQIVITQAGDVDDSGVFYIQIETGETDGWNDSSLEYAIRMESPDDLTCKVVAWGSWAVVTPASKKC